MEGLFSLNSLIIDHKLNYNCSQDPVDATTSTPGQSNQRVREEPIAELQSHNYVLQYGPPISTTANFSGVPLNTIFTSAGNSSLPTSIFQQQKIQPIQLESNTIVLTASTGSAANSPRRQLNGPERNGERCDGILSDF